MTDTNSNEDLFAQWRSMRDSMMETWAKSMVDTVNSDAYAQASGAMLNAFLTTYGPFRELMEKTIARSMEQLNMPTRSDVISLAERLTNIEMRLDDMDAKLDHIGGALSQLTQSFSRIDSGASHHTRTEMTEQNPVPKA